MNPISNLLKQRVRSRARYRCEYCLTHEVLAGSNFTIDHVIPTGLEGEDDSDNLCLCCFFCNVYKGMRVTAVDLQSGELVPIFNPRRQNWQDNFFWSEDGIQILGKTKTGRATVEALKLNRKKLASARRFWVRHNIHPPRYLRIRREGNSANE